MGSQPLPGTNSVVASGETPVEAVPAGALGCTITNPSRAVDQGIGTAEILFVDPVTDALTIAHGTTFALQPGQSWSGIPNQTTRTTVNCLTGGHRFSVVYWVAT